MGEGVIYTGHRYLPEVLVVGIDSKLGTAPMECGLHEMGIRGGRTHYRSWCSVSIEMLLFFEEEDCSSLCQFAKLSLTLLVGYCQYGNRI